MKPRQGALAALFGPSRNESYAALLTDDAHRCAKLILSLARKEA